MNPHPQPLDWIFTDIIGPLFLFCAVEVFVLCAAVLFILNQIDVPHRSERSHLKK